MRSRIPIRPPASIRTITTSLGAGDRGRKMTRLIANVCPWKFLCPLFPGRETLSQPDEQGMDPTGVEAGQLVMNAIPTHQKEVTLTWPG